MLILCGTKAKRSATEGNISTRCMDPGWWRRISRFHLRLGLKRRQQVTATLKLLTIYFDTATCACLNNTLINVNMNVMKSKSSFIIRMIVRPFLSWCPRLSDTQARKLGLPYIEEGGIGDFVPCYLAAFLICFLLSLVETRQQLPVFVCCHATVFLLHKPPLLSDPSVIEILLGKWKHHNLFWVIFVDSILIPQ